MVAFPTNKILSDFTEIYSRNLSGFSICGGIMGKSQEVKPLRPKEYYRDRIVKIVSEIQSESVLQYIYIIVSDIKEESR